jgi:transposase
LLALVMAQAQTIAAQQGTFVRQQETIAQLRDTVARLEARVAELERQLGRNSGNSSMPPSLDDQPGHTPPADKPQRGGLKRKAGKQKGAPGSGLAWRESPDETLEHFPSGACGCGADLAGAADLGVAVAHQQHDIPRVTARVVQHNRHRVQCACGVAHVAPLPDGVADAPTSYGVDLQALCVFLLVVHAVPVHRCAQIVAALTGATPSPGFVHGMLRRTWSALSEVDKRIRALVALAYVVNLDETPLRVGAKRTKQHLLVASTRLYTYFMLGSRNLATFKAFVLAELTGVVVHDRYANYDSAQLTDARAEAGLPALVHQLCAAHLLRDLAAVAEAYPDEHWPMQIIEALQGLIHAANTAREKGFDAIDPDEKADLLMRFRHGVLVGLKDIPRVSARKQSEFRLLLECLRDREADVLRFVDDPRIPATNNQAERDLRPAKTQQKISGRLRCEKTTSYRYRIASYTSTAAKHGIGTLQAIRDALLGRPWLPPMPITA